jgi:hypothetical protein
MNEVAETYLLETIKSLRGLKSNCEKAIAQINDEELHFQSDPESNSVAIIMKHLAGNMLSRFTDLLTSDGEKEWRKRDQEFIDENLAREKLTDLWNRGWNCLFDALEKLSPGDLLKIILIRSEEHTVIRALNRQLVHYAYHAGQIVYICKQIRKSEFKSLSIPRSKEVR